MLFQDSMKLLPATEGKRQLECSPSAGPDSLVIERIAAP